MRAVCNTDLFSRKLALVSRGVSARSTIQLLGGILLEAEEEAAVRLSATDMEISIQTSSVAEVEEGGRVVIPARIFNDVVRSLREGEISLVHDRSEGVVRLSARENEYRIRAYVAEDFPQLPRFDEAGAFKMSGEALVETVEKVARSYSRDETRPVLTGILISFEESQVRMVTTDSYRLSIKETELATTFDGSREAIIPARAMQEVSRIYASSDEEQIEVSLSENQALFRIGDVLFGTRLIEGNFPEYKRLLPNAFEREISVSKEDLVDSLRRVSLFTQRQTPPVPVSLDFSEGAVEVTVRNGEVGEARERLPATSEDDFHISFNPNYLLDGVSAVDSEEILFKLNESLKPGLIVPKTDGEEPDFLYLIMPMRDPARS
jgi:DNA polymerase III subunit beta